MVKISDTDSTGKLGGEIILYNGPKGDTHLDVRLEKETVWLTQLQMAELFERDQSVISRHIRAVFKSRELLENSNMQKMHITDLGKPTTFYSLDLIISVGYRVNSIRGTQFRMWATQVLKDHLIKGFTANEHRLRDLNQTFRLVHLVADIAERRDLSGDEAKAVLRVISDYSYALEVLDDYDHQRMDTGVTSLGCVSAISIDEAREFIGQLAVKFDGSSLFGIEKDSSLEGTLSTIMQTFEGHDLYPSFEEKAATLLYLLVKNHHFVDGNKRIAAALFLWFMSRNQFLYRSDGTKRIGDNALVAMTLLMAESRPEDKDILIRVIMNLINGRNL